MNDNLDLLGDDAGAPAAEFIPAPARERAPTVLVIPPKISEMTEKGRKLYTQNQIRQAFHQLASQNIDAVQTWLHQVAADSPAKAVELFIEVAKFSLPQLKETALTVTQNNQTRTYRSSEEILQELNGSDT